jgi:hypothetical protein
MAATARIPKSSTTNRQPLMGVLAESCLRGNVRIAITDPNAGGICHCTD